MNQRNDVLNHVTESLNVEELNELAKCAFVADIPDVATSAKSNTSIYFLY